MKIILFGFVLLILQAISVTPNSYVDEIFKWKKFDFEHSLDLDTTYFVGPFKHYIPQNVNLFSMGYHPASGLMIVAFRRTLPGIPTALGAFCMSEYSIGTSPVIWKFPNYHANELFSSDFEQYTDIEGRKQWNPLVTFPKNQWETSLQSKYEKSYYTKSQFPIEYDDEKSHDLNRIVSVFQITVDEKCNRVFFVDNGQLTYNRSQTYVIHKPALVVVGLPKTSCHIRNFPIDRRIEIPDRITERGSDGFEHITLDYQPGDACDGLYLYIVNTLHNYLVTYDVRNNDFWSFSHETFEPVLAESFFTFDKVFNYNLVLGVSSIALGFPDENGDRTAYYAPISGTGQYAVSTKILKDKSKSGFVYNSPDFKIKGYRGCDHQAIKMVTDYTYGIMFYSEVQSNQIRCWNLKKPLNPDNIGVVYESDKLKFVNQMFIDSLGYIWFTSSHISPINTTDLPLKDEYNSQIFRMKVSDIIKGTVCYDK